VTQPAAWYETAAPEIDFCVHVLVADGLRVPPFDAHPDGSGAVRAAGLTDSDWRGWFRRVVAAQRTMTEWVRSAGDLVALTPEAGAILAGLLDQADPVSAWAGSAAIGERLRQLWAAYVPDGEAWRRRAAAPGGPVDLEPWDVGRLWQVVERGRPPGSRLETYLVQYPAPVVDALRPDTLVIAPGPGATADGYLRLLQHGITQLAEATR
jgi:hypothetical protein